MSQEMATKDLHELANAMALAYVDDPKYPTPSKVVHAIAEDLGHVEWIGDKSHWVWGLVEQALLAPLADGAMCERWLAPKAVHWAREQVRGQESSLVTLDLPKRLGTVESRLYGPAMGDPEIDEPEVMYKATEGHGFMSRCVHLGRRPSAQLTVEMRDGEITRMYGGPARPPEPNDPAVETTTESRLFWIEHALAV